MKFFQRLFESETGKDLKKVREGSPDCSQISQASDIPDDIFTKIWSLLTESQF